MVRKGFLLVEMIVILALLTTLSIVFVPLFRSLLTDLPGMNRIYNTQTQIEHLALQVRRDVDAATSLPASFDAYIAGEKVLILEQSAGVVVYQLETDQVRRRVLNLQATGPVAAEITWDVPETVIAWNRRQTEGKAYAVEMTTGVKQKLPGRIVTRLANAQVFFLGAMPQTGDTP